MGAMALGAVCLVGLASATPSGRSISPSQEVAWPWEPRGSAPAGTSDNNWEHGKGDLADTQFSYLKQINVGNVSKLKIAWQNSFAPPDYTGGIQSVPMVVSGKGKNLPLESGTMFLSANKGMVALDPTNGKVLWQYIGPNPKPSTPGGTPANQLQYGNTTKVSSFCNGKVITGQQDGSIVALDAKTGAPIWTNQVSSVSEFAGHTGQTSPVTDCDPSAGPNHDGLVFAGPNGSSSPLRGHLDAIDAKTGQTLWRWFTTPDPTQLPFILTWQNPAEAALGGGGTWNSSAIDPGLHMVYTSSGNAYAQLGRQPGKDLWTATTFALDEETGQLKWYWQEAHHDNWDLDHGNAPIIMNLKIDGKVYPAIWSCNKAGNCEVLDRRDGRPLPNFPMKEVPVSDPSGKGLALNHEWPTQPVSACLPFTAAALAHDDNPPAPGSKCAMANVLIHCPNEADVKKAYPTYPVGPDGKPMSAECQFSSTYSDHWTIYPTCSCGVNYNRNSYDPITNNLYVCANNQFTAQENVSPTDWHKSSAAGPIISVWLSAINMSNNTLSWLDRFVGATYQNGVLTGGVNPGFAQGTWSKGCYGGVLSTAGNLVFVDSWGDSTRGSVVNLKATDPPFGGTLAAFNATTGAGPLWTWQAPEYINASPMTYQVKGKQYIALYHLAPQIGSPLYNGHHDQLTVFTLP
jgi:glucose dehydrogenase